MRKIVGAVAVGALALIGGAITGTVQGAPVPGDCTTYPAGECDPPPSSETPTTDPCAAYPAGECGGATVPTAPPTTDPCTQYPAGTCSPPPCTDYPAGECGGQTSTTTPATTDPCSSFPAGECGGDSATVDTEPAELAPAERVAVIPTPSATVPEDLESCE